MDGVNEPHFYQHRWHFGLLEYIEVVSTPNSTALGEVGADGLTNFFRKGLPLMVTATVPDFKSGGLRGPWPVRIWVGIKMYTNEYVCVLHIRDATPFPKGHENIMISSEYRNGLMVVEDPLELTYDCERQIFLSERVA